MAGLDSLPKTAIIAFAARCARRMIPLIHHYWTADPTPYLRAVYDAINDAENFAATGIAVALTDASAFSTDNGDYIIADRAAEAGIRMQTSPVVSYGNAWEAAMACFAAADLARAVAAKTKSATWRYAGEVAKEARERVLRTTEVDKDLSLLVSISDAESWNKDTRIPPYFFAAHSQFYGENITEEKESVPDEETSERETIIQIANSIDAAIVQHFSRYPNDLYKLTARQFEQLLSELLGGIGYQVELTAATRDGGYDIAAIKHDEFGASRFLIECKKYAQNRAVSVGVVRSLHGVVESEGATKGIIATTGRFSGPAKAHFEKHKYILEPRDFEGITNWLSVYQMVQMSKNVRYI